MTPRMGVSGRIAAYFQTAQITPLLALVALLAGLFAVLVTPREEEPQINVTMANVIIPFPGASVRDVERSIASLPPNYRKVDPPEFDGDMKDWPRIAKLQSELLVHAFASGQTRVASYMLTKCQGLTRFPWLGYTAARHHDYTHRDGKAPGADTLDGQRIMRDICRWHVEEFAWLLGRLKATPEGDGNLHDNTLLVFVHEHAEANPHKTSGMAAILAGHAGSVKSGRHSMLTGTVGDLYLTLAEEVMKAPIGKFPSATQKLTDIV